MSLAVLIPTKALNDVKQRLAPLLNAEQRRRLFEAMLRDLLQQIGRVDSVNSVLLIGGDEEIASIATDNGAYWLAERGNDLNAAVTQGVAALKASGRGQVLILHGDLPLAGADEISQLISSHYQQNKQISLVADNAGQGTNALLVNTDCAVEFSYGEGSLQRHEEQFKDQGIDYQTLGLPGLGFDIDTPNDVNQLALILTDSPRQAPLTWMVIRHYIAPLLIDSSCEQRESA
ncbi:Phosphoenolpyruvate guanylyltransferase [Sinobacterium norvegicum]|uniref:3-phospho-D-glycerate guanylyltransferase n=1 Tax=Sinobacterium norvegicum TaxID=1641715 RepID=A0ABN8ENR5_9GAMM|nr:2-phospho-L-lactate guanylyltransferase [Sinobacterium norvegicum]CAH0992602.1 Phosphoenolpyruvate guanylyltransferase [Sinobacterium norvegicum]